MAQSSGQPLFDLWKQQVEEGSQAWLRMLGQGQPTDPQSFWRPFMDQGMAAWSKVMTQGPPSPDLMAQWKQFLDQWIAAWSKVLEQAMGTETFAKAMGKQMETFLNVSAPVRKAADQQIEAGLAGPRAAVAHAGGGRGGADRPARGQDRRARGSHRRADAADPGAGRSGEGAARVIGRTIDGIEVGDTAEITRRASEADIAGFVEAVGDYNPVHSDPAYAAETPFKEPIAPGIWTAGLISAVIGTRLPGPGAIYMSQDLKFLRPVKLGDVITAGVSVIDVESGEEPPAPQDRVHEPARRGRVDRRSARDAVAHAGDVREAASAFLRSVCGRSIRGRGRPRRRRCG